MQVITKPAFQRVLSFKTLPLCGKKRGGQIFAASPQGKNKLIKKVKTIIQYLL
jgi:hypothetical protein